jgi:hypothetical protein
VTTVPADLIKFKGDGTEDGEETADREADASDLELAANAAQNIRNLHCTCPPAVRRDY